MPRALILPFLLLTATSLIGSDSAAIPLSDVRIAGSTAAAPRVKPYGADAFLVLPAVAFVAACGDSVQRIAPSLSAGDGVAAGHELFLTYSERVPLSFVTSLSPVVDEVERLFARILDAGERRRAVSRH